MRRRALAEQALQLAREAADPKILAQVLRDCLFALWAPDTLEYRKRLVDELLELADASADPTMQFWAADFSRSVHIESAEFDKARAAAHRAAGFVSGIGQPTLEWFAKFPTAGLALLWGDLVDAEQLADEAIQIGQEAGEPDAFMVYGSQLAFLRVYQGRGEEVVELFQESVAAFPRISGWQAGLAMAYCWIDRPDDAAAIVAHAAEDGFEHVPWDQIRTTALALYADAASLLGLTDAAAAFYRLIEQWGNQVVWTVASGYGHASTYLGLLAATLGWEERADEHLAFACEFHEREGLPIWTARARLGWAESLARRGDPRRASEEAAHALRLSREHGYGAFESRAAAIVAAESAASAERE